MTMWWRHLRTVLIGPVTVTIVVPVLLTVAWGTAGAGIVAGVAAPWRVLGVAVGAVLALTGVAMLGWTISLFHRVGHGTLSPLDPPRALVVVGPYRHVRNPMFTGVLAIVLGEALATGTPILLAWWALFFTFLAMVIPLVEEPRLARRFGDDYTHYRANVPRWLPRFHPWQPEQATPARTPPSP